MEFFKNLIKEYNFIKQFFSIYNKLIILRTQAVMTIPPTVPL